MNDNTNITLDNDGKVILVNDSIMGSGKTQWAIQEMNAHPEKQWIFCSPFLEELERIKSSCPKLHFRCPAQIDGRKLNGFKDLLDDQENICVTHKCFTNADSEVFDLLRDSGYSLIIDEEINVLDEFNKFTDKTIKRADVDMMIDRHFIEIDPLGQVKWIERSYADTLYGDVELMAERGNLFCVDKKMLFWRFPPQMWGLFEDVTVLTYFFSGSMLQAYFDYYQFKYKKVSTVQNEDGSYKLIDYSKDAELEKRKEIADLITVYGGDLLKINTSKRNFLGSRWCDTNSKKNPEIMDSIKKSMVNLINNRLKAKADRIIWTTYKRFRPTFEGKGYKRYAKTEAEIAQLEAENPDQKVDHYNYCFLECNARATNNYSNKNTLMYILNLSPNPETLKFFDLKNAANGNKDIKVDADVFALSNFLQWTWRSAIRNGEHIDIYIPSDRIRNLFLNWLSGKI